MYSPMQKKFSSTGQCIGESIKSYNTSYHFFEVLAKLKLASNDTCVKAKVTISWRDFLDYHKY